MGEMFGRLPHEIANLNWSDYKFNLECYACLANLRENQRNESKKESELRNRGIKPKTDYEKFLESHREHGHI